MCDKAVDTCTFVFDSVPGRYMIQEMCEKVVSKEHFMLNYCPDRYKTQELCDNAVDSYRLALRFVPDWLLTSKMIEKLDNAVFSNDDIVFGDINADIVTFFSNDLDHNRPYKP